MTLNLTQKLTLTQAVLTLCVLLPAGAAVYLATTKGLLRENLKNADLAVQTTAREVLSQLDEDVLVEFKGRALPFADLRITTKHWALVRGNGDVVNGGGVFQGGSRELVGQALDSQSLEFVDGGTLLVASVPVPKVTYEPLDGLPPELRSSLRKVCPGGAYIRNKREVLETQTVRELKVLMGNDLVEVYITEDGKFLGGEREELPRAFPAGYTEELVGPAGSRTLANVEWKAFEGQLIAVLTFEAEGRKPTVAAVNRYGERFTVEPDGDLSGPTDETAIRLIAAVPATRAPGALLAVLLVGGPLVWILVVVIGWFITRRAFSPVEELVSAAERVRSPHLDARLPIGKAKDELSRIAETMNRMLDRLEQGFLREKRFTGDASHELKGPLAKVIAEIDLILSTDRSIEEYREALVRCRGYADSMRRIVESLLLLARLDRDRARLETEPTDVETLLVDVVNSLSRADAERVQLEIGESEDPTVARCAGRLISVLVRNLIENALRYSPREEKVTVRLRRASGKAVFEVEDRGPGIPEDCRDQVFDRFFRLDESRSRDTGGVGLGLAIVQAIAHGHGSEVRLRSSAERGTTMATFDLPLSEPAKETRGPVRTGSKSPGRRSLRV